MTPTIAYDFNFDWILIMLFSSYILYGYFSGGHKQIRIFINLILPFILLYYLSRYISRYLYLPLSRTALFNFVDTVGSTFKYTIGMGISYIVTYIFLFSFVFVLGMFAKRYLLNENMRAYLGIKNNYLGALFALINGYVLVYFIILPVFSLDLIGPEAKVTNFVLNTPPPFSRIGRTAQKAIPIKGLADKAEAFEELISVDGIEGYYNEAIYSYQLEYMGSEDSYEQQFMDEVYIGLSEDSKTIIDDYYFSWFSEELSVDNFLGVSRVLVGDTLGDDLIYEELIEAEELYFNANPGHVNVTVKLMELGENFRNHKGMLMWYVDELDREMTASSDGDITATIVSFKGYYDTMIEQINDPELEEKLYLAKLSIDSYDVFSLWMNCTTDNIDTVPLEELDYATNRCDPSASTEPINYDFTSESLELIATIFDGESVSWVIMQFKYDYEAGIFDELAEQYEAVDVVLEGTKELVDDYDNYYKDIANSIEGNVSMVFKIGVSAVKYNFDAYETLEDIPLLSAFMNDVYNFCSDSDPSAINPDVNVCPITTGEGSFIELFNMRYLISEVIFKAYLMVDEENNPRVFDEDEMEEFLDQTDEAVKKNIFVADNIIMLGNQFAFNVIDDETNMTLLEQMYNDGQITVEAMQVLAEDEHDLFSVEFTERVLELIED